MTSKLKVKEKDISVPGEVLAMGMDYIPGDGVYRDGDDLRAKRLGLVTIEGKVVKLTPLSGRYVPKINDKVVAKVTDILLSGWRVDIGSAWSAVLNMKDATSEFIARGADLTQYFSLGEYIFCKITNVTSQKLVDISMRGPGLKKLSGGRLVSVNAMKVPRIIGREGSMISMVKQGTGCDVTVGQNGRIWINGEPDMEIVAVDTIKMIEQQAHLLGLTDRIKTFLKEKTGKDVEPRAEPQEREERRPRRESRNFRPRRKEGAFHDTRKPRYKGRRQ